MGPHKFPAGRDAYPDRDDAGDSEPRPPHQFQLIAEVWRETAAPLGVSKVKRTRPAPGNA